MSEPAFPFHGRVLQHVGIVKNSEASVNIQPFFSLRFTNLLVSREFLSKVLKEAVTFREIVNNSSALVKMSEPAFPFWVESLLSFEIDKFISF